MNSRLRKTAVAAVSSLALALSVSGVSTPAAAQGWRGGGWHGGGWHGGGWNGGGWHGGGWNGGGWNGGGWRGGPGWRGGWGPGWRGAGWGGGCWNCGWGWGGAAAAGLAGGLALGAIAATAAPAYGGCFLQNQPVYNSWGQFAGYQRVRVCY